MLTPLMRQAGWVVCLLGMVLASPAAAAQEPAAVDPIALYGPEIRFDVLRDGTRLGSHVVRFDRRGDRLTVRVRFELSYRFLSIPLYVYTYAAETQWRDGRLVFLSARTDDDGDRSAVEARIEDGRLVVDGPNGTSRVAPPIYPTHHWHRGVVGENRVLNTITGKVNRVTITPAGTETIDLAEGRIDADRYVYSGDLRNEVWYDKAGRWVKMRFDAHDGSIIDYVCRSCVGMMATAGADP